MAYDGKRIIGRNPSVKVMSLSPKSTGAELVKSIRAAGTLNKKGK